MKYYEVFVGSGTFHGQEPLTYACEQNLSEGQLVQVPLRQQHILGIISKNVSLPTFLAKKVDVVFALPPLPKESLQLLEWLNYYYPSGIGVVTQQFLPKSLSEKLIISSPTNHYSEQKIHSLEPLTAEQEKALAAIGESGSLLLHGETGSGKTRIYLELARKALDKDTSAIILTPEISLTTQLVSVFENQFKGHVIVVHSQLTELERRTAWLSILTSKKPVVIIGARSALFSPVKRIGLIVIDESHEAAYKQEQAPHYQAQRVASKLAQLHQAVLVLGSATPSVNDYYTAAAKHLPILRLKELANKSDTTKPDITVVDLKDRKEFSRSPHISTQLLQLIEQALDRSEQSLLFLNRRGTARIIICQNCGWQALCPNCDLPLTYHGDNHQIRCHVCGHHETAPNNCPVCKNTNILFKSIGTKAIVEEVSRIFPQARIQRFDNDNTKSEQFNQHYDAVKAGEVDILVGTQTLAKGLDLPRLSVVGVIVADTSLYVPDYTANERTYQLLYQVLGRVSRGHTAGHAIIQTYEPENPLIRAAVNKDWESFYENELNERRQFMFPPFCFLLKLSCRRVKNRSAELAAEHFCDELRKQPLKIQIIGPSPAFHEKMSGKFQWQLVIKSKQRGELIKVIELLPNGWSYDIDPTDLL
jgi:primosomal protein N' (replication factor Y)